MTTPKPKQRVTGAELSRLSGYAASSITGFTKSGIIERGGDGKFDSVTALKAIANHETSRQQDGRRPSTAGKLRETYLRKRIERLQLEIDRERGLYVNAEDLKQALTRAYAQARVVLEKLPKNIGRDLGVEAQKLADVHVDAALAELAKDPL